MILMLREIGWLLAGGYFSLEDTVTTFFSRLTAEIVLFILSFLVVTFYFF